MALRHTPRQAERDLRLHEPHAVHPLPPPQHPQPHLNGNAVGPPVALNGGPHPGPSHISPKAPPAGAPPANLPPSIQKLVDANEQTWLVIGSVAEQMNDLEHALSAYENALRHNPYSIPGLTQVAGIARIKENYQMAVDYFQRVLNLQPENGEIWSALGHCYLMQDDLQKAYQAYQHALYSLPNPKENPKLWYGIGILYDRYGSLDNAEEAFSSVLKMDKDFDKSNEVLFRLGIIYKQQTKYDESLRCFEKILRNPPSPLANADIYFQIGHVYEQQGDHNHAREAYERVVHENPGHAKVLQQLGWLYHQDGPSFQNQELAIQYLTKSLEADPSDAQSWYLLGRAFMAGQKYNKAYEAYQQAVYRDGRNPTFWCSIGVLYFQINQYRDALDAYSRAIRINPYIPEVWFDLGSLYESCNNQIGDAIDAYSRAAELDPQNIAITQRLQVLKHSQATGAQISAAPAPQDVHPTAYANAAVPAPSGLGGPPLMMHGGVSARPMFRADSRGPVESNQALPPPPPHAAGRTSPAPFRGGPPPPVVIDESRIPTGHHQLAPMDVDHPLPPPGPREVGNGYLPLGREASSSGRLSHLLHHTPQAHEPEPPRAGPSSHDTYYSRHARAPSMPASPPSAHAARPRSPGTSPYQSYPPASRPPVGPGQLATHTRSPHGYPREPGPGGVPMDRTATWEAREWERDRERDRRARPGTEYPPAQQAPYYPPRVMSPPPQSHRRSPRILHDRTPPQTSPASAHPGAPRNHWDSRYGPPPSQHMPPSPRSATDHHIARPEPMQIDSHVGRSRASSRAYDTAIPEAYYDRRNGPPVPVGNGVRGSESPHLSQRGMMPLDSKTRSRRGTKDKEPEMLAGPASGPSVFPMQVGPIAPEPKKTERKKRQPNKRAKDDRSQTETPKPYGAERLPNQPPPFKVAPPKPNDSPEPASNRSAGSSGRSVQPSPTTTAPRGPNRVVDEDYDEGVADALMGLAAYRAPEPLVPVYSNNNTSGPAMPPAPRQTSPTPSLHSHRGSISSTRSNHSSSVPGPIIGMKRPLSPAAEEMEMKRTKMEAPKRRVSSPAPHSSRPSPIPFRTQPSSVSPEVRQADKNQPMSQPSHPSSYPPSPQLPAVLPPHPRPIGAGLSSSHMSNSVALPPIATLSPASSAPSPPHEGERRSLEQSQSRDITPPGSRGKMVDVMNPAGPPPSKPSPSSAE